MSFVANSEFVRANSRVCFSIMNMFIYLSSIYFYRLRTYMYSIYLDHKYIYLEFGWYTSYQFEHVHIIILSTRGANT